MDMPWKKWLLLGYMITVIYFVTAYYYIALWDTSVTKAVIMLLAVAFGLSFIIVYRKGKFIIWLAMALTAILAINILSSLF